MLEARYFHSLQTAARLPGRPATTATATSAPRAGPASIARERLPALGRGEILKWASLPGSARSRGAAPSVD